MENPSADERSVSVRFFSEPVHMKFESEKEGRPIYKEMPHVSIIIPGDKNTMIECKASEEHKQRYPVAWARFQRGESTVNIGTPLEQWPQITRAQVKEAKYVEVHTVEQLANLSDDHAAKMGMGFRALRQSAKDYLETAKNGAADSAKAAENARLRDELEAMKAQIAALSSAAKVGRPRKETAEA
jgi:hypothetical protein